MAKRKAEALSPARGQAITPSRRRTNKKVRFSTGTIPGNGTAQSANTTGLTPAINRALLSTPQRRASTPARLGYQTSSSPTSEYDYIQFTPLRQQLDERCKRRIRRNGLSDVVNEYQSEKRDNTHLRHEIRRKDQELQQLLQELGDLKQQAHTTDQQIQTDLTESRVEQIEVELSQLRRSFGIDKVSNGVDWDGIPTGAAGPRSTGGDTMPIYEDDTDPYQTDVLPAPVPSEDRVDATIMSLELASARQAKQDMLNSFSRNNRSFEAEPLDFVDSPARPRELVASVKLTPKINANDLQKQLTATRSRAEDAELALAALEGEIRALGFSHPSDSSASADLAALADHFRTIRLELENLLPGETTIAFDNKLLFPELVKRIKQLHDDLLRKGADFENIRTQNRNLRGNFDQAIIAEGKARNKVNELEKSIDEAAEETLHVRMKNQELERTLAERESDVQRLKEALEKYYAEVSRLEALINQVEDDHKTAMTNVQSSVQDWEAKANDADAKASAETLGRRKAEESAVSRLAKIQQLEETLSKAKTEAESKAKELRSMQEKESRGEQEADQLKIRISSISTALTSAEAEIKKLKAINQTLEERYEAEIGHATNTVERIQQRFLKYAGKMIEDTKSYKRGSKVRYANHHLESDDYPTGEDGLPLTPASTVRFADPEEDEEEEDNEEPSSPTSEHVPGSVEVGRGKKKLPLTPAISLKNHGRRRYDSGVGMSPLGEESEPGLDDSGLATPDLSSEADVEMSVEV